MSRLMGGQPFTAVVTPTLALQQPSTLPRERDENSADPTSAEDMLSPQDGDRENQPVNSTLQLTRAASSQKSVGSQKQGSLRGGTWHQKNKHVTLDAYEEECADMD
jgi:hypothetical protein